MDATLLGVIVGGLLAGGASFGQDALRSRRESRSERKRERTQLQQAVRLVLEELADAEQQLREAVKAGYYWPPPRVLSTDVWTEYRLTLAGQVESPLSWAIITRAFEEVNRLNWVVLRRRAEHSPVSGRPEHEGLREEDKLREAWRSIHAGIGELERTIGVQGPASRVLREADEIEAELWPGAESTSR